MSKDEENKTAAYNAFVISFKIPYILYFYYFYFFYLIKNLFTIKYLYKMKF